MSRCKVCGNSTEEIVDFGSMPIANGFLVDPNVDEYFFNLKTVFCPKCFMVQLAETVPAEKMFHDDYQFKSSTSEVMEKHFEDMANEIIAEVGGKSDPLVIEIGSNDGIMLKHIADAGIKHLGVEPSGNVAELSRMFGVNAVVKFFNEAFAKEVLSEYGSADVISGANVICHIEDINSVFEGVELLLGDDGIFMFEEPYIYDIVQKNSFDQMYDEHIYYYSALSVRELGRRNGLDLFDVLPISHHGGSARYYLCKQGTKKIEKRLTETIEKEKVLKLDEIGGYRDFAKNVDKICTDLKKLLNDLRNQRKRVVGYGATSKSTTTLNRAGIGPELIEYITDTTVNKIGKFTPGTHIPIKDHETFAADDVEYVLLLAWNHREEIEKKEQNFIERGGKFITYYPEVAIHGEK